MESARDGEEGMVCRLEPDQACLVLREGTEADAEAVRLSLLELGVRVMEEKRFLRENGLITLIVVLPARDLSDLMLDLALRGVGGELIGYEGSGGMSTGRRN